MSNLMEEDVFTVDLKAFLKVIWKEKLLIFGIILVFAILGIWFAFSLKKEYVSEGKILPEISSGGGGSLGGLADLVGIGGFELGMKNNTDAIRPDLYPDVIKTAPFFLGLLEQTFITQNSDSIRFNEYCDLYIIESSEESTQEAFKGRPEGVIVLDQLTESKIKELRERVVGSIDKKSGVISISAKMPDPVIAAEIAHYAMNYLTGYVSTYRTEKLRSEVDFLENKVASAKGTFYKDQSKKAVYEDQFSAATMRLKSADVQRERIESEYKMSTSIYNELLKKYEESKLKLKQETPIFQILEPPMAPNLASEPKKGFILGVFILIGFLVSLVATLFVKKNHRKVFLTSHIK
ncbi:Wzz/FepE/Etk N-terminal domain-containing protein [uncultured Arcticibacterium sp.]|uniref:Wzz/FepE/Etk N-terminal domain-containing protein n=1 Tax=uncultured Arcticibacterium sp. TaxID=2173042 RepID=UPI0030F6F5C5